MRGGTGAAITGLGAGNIGLVGGNVAGVGVRADVLGVDSTGTGFVTYDINGFRLLTTTEYSPLPNQPSVPSFAAITTPVNNVLLNTPVYSTVSTTDRQPAPRHRRQPRGLRWHAGGVKGYYSAALASSYTAANFATPNGASYVDWNAAGALNTITLTGGVILANANNGGIQGGQITDAGQHFPRL